MSNIRICQVENKIEENEFIRLPWRIYKGDSNWVPPLISEFKRTIEGKNNTLKESGPYALLLAYKEDEAVGRVCVGINELLNNAKNYREGYISLFECIDDYDVAKVIFDYAISWLGERGMERIIGPLSLPDGDDNRGLLIDNFDDPPAVMNVYNPRYYRNFFERYGFYKYWDCYAYYFDLTKELDERYKRVSDYAMKKYGFHIDKLDLKNMEKEMEDVKKIIELAMPQEWEDFIPPTDGEIKIIAKNLIPVADPDLIYIARTNEGRPIAFNIALPDYNQVLSHMDGKLFPFGFLKFLYYKRKITRARLFVLFVIPEFRKKGVTGAIYYRGIRAAKEKGFTLGEGSTIWEYNHIMQRDVESVGGKIYKTYRIYKKDIF